MTPNDCHFNYSMNIILALFNSVVLLSFFILTIKVYQKVKFNDKYVLAMLLFLQFHVLCTVVFYSLNATLYSARLCGSDQAAGSDPAVEQELKAINNAFSLVNYASITFLSTSVLINCRNW